MNRYQILAVVVVVLTLIWLVIPRVWIDNAKLYLTGYWVVGASNTRMVVRSLRPDKVVTKKLLVVDEADILAGGPAKDGIPSVDNPQFSTVKLSSFKAEDLVVGVYYQGVAKAYPYGILNWHEIVNDTIGDLPITVTLCPLCDTNPVFVRQVDGKTTTFGVSGRLFQSCLVMYDRLTNSLWAQPWGMSIKGIKSGKFLRRIAGVKTTLGAWMKKYPQTQVLTTDTGYQRDYHRYPYGDYYNSSRLIFPARGLKKLGKRHPKNIDSYVVAPDNSGQNFQLGQYHGKAYKLPHSELAQEGERSFTMADITYRAVWDKVLKTVLVYDKQGQMVPTSTAFAFVFPSFF